MGWRWEEALRHRNSSEIYNQRGNYKIAYKFMYMMRCGMRRMKTKQRFADKTDFDIGSEIDTRRW